MLKALIESPESEIKEKLVKEDEILGDNWVQHSRKKGQEKGLKSETSHLDGLNWEILVVNEPVVNAFCLPGGKIVVFTGVLEHFKTDAEIAAMIGHEVGHAVARHSAERVGKNLWFTSLEWIFYPFVIGLNICLSKMLTFRSRLRFSQRIEMEADHIGMLLMASAGYDPRVVPKVYEKLGQIFSNSTRIDDLATHPLWKKRAKLLAQAKVMEEALTIYKEGQDMESK